MCVLSHKPRFRGAVVSTTSAEITPVEPGQGNACAGMENEPILRHSGSDQYQSHDQESISRWAYPVYTDRPGTNGKKRQFLLDESR
mgnify:CR=1 FL=1